MEEKMEEMIEEKIEETVEETTDENKETPEAATMDDLSEELEASYKAAEEEGAEDSEDMDPVWATLTGYLKDKTVLNVKIGGIVNAGVSVRLPWSRPAWATSWKEPWRP